MTDLVVLFLHHSSCQTTRRNLRLVRENAEAPVVPVRLGERGALPDSLDLGPTRHNWSRCDEVFYRYHRLGQFPAERYVLVEWDCMVTAPLRSLYAPVWDEHCSAAGVLRGMDAIRRWSFGQEVKNLPEKMHPHATAVLPCNGVMLSHECLSAVADEAMSMDLFSELRLGTLATRAGFKWRGWKVQGSNRPGCERTAISGPGFYHPVKA